MCTTGTELIGSNEAMTSMVITLSTKLDILCRFRPMEMWLRLVLQRVAIAKDWLACTSGITQHGCREGTISLVVVLKISLVQMYLFRTMEIVLRLESRSEMEVELMGK